MNNMKRAIVAGHICLDIIPDLGHLEPGLFHSLFQPGQLITTGRAHYATGGPVPNTGLALHQLGIPTQLIAKVGADAFGQIVRDLIRQYDSALDTEIVIDEGEVSSYSIIISPPGVDRIFLHCPGANDTFSADDIDYGLVSQAHLFHFGYPPVMKRMYQAGGTELADVFQRAKATGVTTSLDMTFPDPTSEGGRVDWRDILTKTLPYVDIFGPSIEEIFSMLRPETYESMKTRGDIGTQLAPELVSNISHELLELGTKIVLLKLGDQGAYVHTAGADILHDLGRAAPDNLPDWYNQMLWSACFEVNVVGTTGAGDATIAGFLSAILRNMSPFEALTMGVAVGACNVEAADALSGLRSWDNTRRRIADGWPRRLLDLSRYGWEYDQNTGIWFNIPQ